MTSGGARTLHQHQYFLGKIQPSSRIRSGIKVKSRIRIRIKMVRIRKARRKGFPVDVRSTCIGVSISRVMHRQQVGQIPINNPQRYPPNTHRVDFIPNHFQPGSSQRK